MECYNGWMFVYTFAAGTAGFLTAMREGAGFGSVAILALSALLFGAKLQEWESKKKDEKNQ